MKKFLFSLESVLGERKKVIEKTQKEMAPTVSRFNRISNMEAKVLRQISFTAIPDPGPYPMSQDYLIDLREVSLHLGKEKKIVQEELNRWQQILSEKIKDKRVIEIIKERRFLEWKKKYNKHLEKNNEEMILKFF